MTVSVAGDAEPQPDRTATVAITQSERGVLTVRGPDRVSWLNGVVTCDTAEVTPGRAAFGLLLSKQGKIQTDFWLVAGEDTLFLAVAPGTAGGTQAELDRMLIMEDAELEDRSGSLALALLVGSSAAELAPQARASGGVAWGALTLRGAKAAAVVFERDRQAEWSAAMAARGARVVVGDDWQGLRLDLGVGSFGTDYGPSDNPHEAGLDRIAVSWSKGCYLGQEVVFMQDARGKLKRRLVLLSVHGGVPGAGSEVRTPAGEVVGELTSVAPVPDGAVALGRLRAPHFEPGSRLVAAGFPAEVQSPESGVLSPEP